MAAYVDTSSESVHEAAFYITNFLKVLSNYQSVKHAMPEK